jgi:hypothetical protein
LGIDHSIIGAEVYVCAFRGDENRCGRKKHFDTGLFHVRLGKIPRVRWYGEYLHAPKALGGDIGLQKVCRLYIISDLRHCGIFAIGYN